MDDEHLRKQRALALKLNPTENWKETTKLQRFAIRIQAWLGISSLFDEDESLLVASLHRCSHSLKGAYLGMRESNQQKSNSQMATKYDTMSENVSQLSRTERGCVYQSDTTLSGQMDLYQEKFHDVSTEEAILASMMAERQKSSQMHEVFCEIDTDGCGTIDLEKFIRAYNSVNGGLSRKEVEMIFHAANVDSSGELDYWEFERVMSLQGHDMIRRLHHAGQRNERGMLEVKPSTEDFFGAEFYASAPPGIDAFEQAQLQHFSMELYESRIASLQRFTALCVMFHQMGKRVQDFFPRYSMGLM